MCNFKNKLLGIFSTSSAELPKLPQRIVNAVKSYIYMPEEGKGIFHSVIICNFTSTLFNEVLFFCPTAFCFPLKLAISAVVSFIALYQVTAQRLSNNHERPLLPAERFNHFLFSGGPFADFRSGATSAESPSGSGWKHRQRFSWVQDYAVSRQTRSG